MKSLLFYSILKLIFFFPEKTIFWYPTFEYYRGYIFSFRITKICVHNLDTYTYLMQKQLLLYHTQGGGNFNLKSCSIFRWVYIFSDLHANSFCVYSKKYKILNRYSCNISYKFWIKPNNLNSNKTSSTYKVKERKKQFKIIQLFLPRIRSRIRIQTSKSNQDFYMDLRQRTNQRWWSAVLGIRIILIRFRIQDVKKFVTDPDPEWTLIRIRIQEKTIRIRIQEKTIQFRIQQKRPKYQENIQKNVWKTLIIYLLWVNTTLQSLVYN